MRDNTDHSLAAFGLAGCVGGALLALAAAATLVLGRFNQAVALVALTSTAALFTPTPTQTPTGTATTQPSATVTAPPTATLSPTDDPQALLMWAERALASGIDAREVLDRLGPVLNQFTEPEDVARAHTYLGAAEYQLGHFQLAAGHFEHLYAYDHSPENLLLLASAYEQAGDLDHALERYLELAQWEGAGAEVFKQYAQDRVAAITEVIGAPTPET